MNNIALNSKINTHVLKNNTKLPKNEGRAARDRPKIDSRAAETTVAYATARPLRYTPVFTLF